MDDGSIFTGSFYVWLAGFWTFCKWAFVFGLVLQIVCGLAGVDDKGRIIKRPGEKQRR